MNDSSKLISLLAMAAGAVAMPQTSRADIIYTDLSGSPVVVGFGGASEYTFSGLPGGAQFGFQKTSAKGYTASGVFPIYYHTVKVGQVGTVKAGLLETTNGFAKPEPKSALVNTGATLYLNIPVGTQTITYSPAKHNPANGYDHQYLAWMFYDTTQSAKRFGWVEIGLSVGATNDPNVTIYGYAYDNQGNPIPMGQVPEPAPLGILALGALALGAKGVRAWRRNRAASCKA